jgi:mercuric ion transport protein
MRRDRWFAVGVIGALLSCLVCVTPLAVLGLGAVGLGAWAGHLDAILLPVLVVFAGLAVYRYWGACRRAR